MNHKLYKLEGKRIVETDLEGWAKFYESRDRIVKKETLPNGLIVSTVFLGIDHRFGEGEPVLFESMVFGMEDEPQERYCTYEEAEKGHQELVDKWSKYTPLPQ